VIAVVRRGARADRQKCYADAPLSGRSSIQNSSRPFASLSPLEESIPHDSNQESFAEGLSPSFTNRCPRDFPRVTHRPPVPCGTTDAMLDRTEGLIHPLFTKNTNDTSCLPKGDRISHKLWKHPNPSRARRRVRSRFRIVAA